MLYAANAFASNVNASLRRYDQWPAFKLENLGGDDWVTSCCSRSRLGLYDDLTKDVRAYRNSLVHEKLLYIQNGLLPKVRHENCQYAKPSHLLALSGLAAIGTVTRNQRILRQCFERLDHMISQLLVRMRYGLNAVWGVANSRMTDVRERYHADNARWDPRDEALTEDDFRAVREFDS
jgi:hypothetical protein